MLSGDKVTLRGMRRSDLERLHHFNNTLAVELAGGGDPPWPQALERVYAEYDSDCAVGGRDGMRFAVERNADQELLGQCALFDLDPVARTAQLGITLGEPSCWGQGFGREAVRLLVDYGFRYQNLRRIWLKVHADNTRAIRCYRASGFEEEGRLRGHVWSNGAYHDLVLMGRLREPTS